MPARRCQTLLRAASKPSSPSKKKQLRKTLPKSSVWCCARARSITTCAKSAKSLPAMMWPSSALSSSTPSRTRRLPQKSKNTPTRTSCCGAKTSHKTRAHGFLCSTLSSRTCQQGKSSATQGGLPRPRLPWAMPICIWSSKRRWSMALLRASRALCLRANKSHAHLRTSLLTS